MRLKITTEFITLEQALKLSRAVSSGGEAKIRIWGGEAAVNGNLCLQRGKKLYPGDSVSLGGQDLFTVERDADQ